VHNQAISLSVQIYTKNRKKEKNNDFRFVIHILYNLILKLFKTTDIELKVMAAPAHIGFSVKPK
jgi:hypothetical protein